jgi:hypothetical protein
MIVSVHGFLADRRTEEAAQATAEDATFHDHPSYANTSCHCLY